MRRGGTDKNCVSDAKGLCFECVEDMYSVLDRCASCDGAPRCVNNASHLLCPDNAVFVDSHCTPSMDQNALLVANNHAVKCREALYAVGDACAGCPPSCAACHNGSSCVVCTSGNSLSPVGVCAEHGQAVVQTHRGAVACRDGFVEKDRSCVPCSSVFGAGCEICSAHEGLSCDAGFVLDSGACRKGDLCDDANGTACTLCASGSVLYNATDCVPAGDCVVYADGRCVQCVKPLVPLATGSCGESADCTAVGDGICLRCGAGMFAGENGVCQRRLSHQLTLRV